MTIIEPVTITEQMMYCTARIVGMDASDVSFKFGTGFFYQSAQNITLLVTNKHVVDATSSIEFVMHTALAGGKRPDGKVSFHIPTCEFVLHPNEKVDLCAAPIQELVNRTNPKPFFRTLNPSSAPSDSQLGELSAVEDILMVGYPNGLWDAANNYPLIRRGITASHPGVDFDVDGVPVTVIDMACFPGSSGSPVMLHNENGYRDKRGNIMHGRTRTMLLGVLFSGPTIRADGKIIVRNIPTTAEPVAQINLMMNLGYIVKSKELAALGNAVWAKCRSAGVMTRSDP